MKIGILVNGLATSQMNYFAINNANTFIKKNTLASITMFYETLQAPCSLTEFPIMQICDAWPFDGAVVATSLSTAVKAARLPSVSKRFFYCYDLEWLRISGRRFGDLVNIYRNESLSLIARSAEHAEIIESCWNRKVDMIMQEFDFGILQMATQ